MGWPPAAPVALNGDGSFSAASALCQKSCAACVAGSDTAPCTAGHCASHELGRCSANSAGWLTGCVGGACVWLCKLGWLRRPELELAGCSPPVVAGQSDMGEE